MSESSAYVIAGAGLAGAKAAETLREEGFDGPVVLIGDETERPYERPPLSKDYLLGKAERDTIYVHPASWYADNGVELRLGVPVTGIDYDDVTAGLEQRGLELFDASWRELSDQLTARLRNPCHS